MIRRTRLSLLFCLLAASSAFGQGERLESLQGVRKIEVIVDDLIGDAATVGQTSRSLRTVVEGRLLPAGPEVADFAVGFLRLTLLAAHPAGSPDYAVHVELSFHQPAAASLNRWMGPAETWSESGLLVTDEGDVGAAVRREVERLVDRFLTDWRTANS